LAIGASLEITGGLAYSIGSFGLDGAMMAAGAATAETGGLAAFPLMAVISARMESENQQRIQPMVDKLEKEGNWFGAALLSMPLSSF
jgi:hypothetical protein